MSPNRLRALFPNPPERIGDQSGDAYLDWYVWERHTNPKAAQRLITLTYDVDQRSFFAVMQRSDTADSEFFFDVYLPAKFVAFLRSLLTDEEIARCTQASLAA